ncbi:hypothetical protein CF319_g8474 [Tilletia indica]|nr:hypothetical protein CF319_g8474 [Tilletia indica]
MLHNSRGIVELIDICHKPGTIDIIMPIYWGTLQDLLDQEGRELWHGDFALAAEVGGPEGTVTIGTVGYSAPECLLGLRKATFQADIWSTGCIVAEMFIGRPLFSYGDDGDETTALKDILQFTGHGGGAIYARRDLSRASGGDASLEWPPCASDSDLRRGCGKGNLY